MLIIPYYDKHPRQGGKLTASLNAEQFKRKFNCNYTHDLIVPEHLAETMKQYIPPQPLNLLVYLLAECVQMKITIKTAMEAKYEEAKQLITKPRTDLAIVNLGPEVGYATIALSKIKKGAALCLYVGKVINETEVQKNDVYMHVYSEPVGQQSQLIVSAAEHRGIAGFLPHLPGNSELEDFSFNSNAIKENVMTCNTMIEELKIGDKTYIVFFAKNDIEPFDLVGTNYGSYWLNYSGERPKFLCKDGSILAQSNYKRDKMVLKLPVVANGTYSQSAYVVFTRDMCIYDANFIGPQNVIMPTGESRSYSTYQFRSQVSTASMLPKIYGHQPNGPIANRLVKLLNNSNIDIKTYIRIPEHVRNPKVEPAKTYTQDIVIIAADRATYEKQITLFAPIKELIDTLDETLEIVIKATETLDLSLKIVDADDTTENKNKINLFLQNLEKQQPQEAQTASLKMRT